MIRMRYLILLISLTSSFGVLALTKEELRSQTESFIRAEQERKQRLQRNELLDDSAFIYFDGNRTYPGLVINGVIYPAIRRAGYRYPACLIEGQLVEGEYDSSSQQVHCEINSIVSPKNQAQSQKQEEQEEEKQENKEKEERENTGNTAKKTEKAEKKTEKSPTKKVKEVKEVKEIKEVKEVKGVKESRESKEKKKVEGVKEAVSQAAIAGAKEPIIEINSFRPSHKFGIRAGSWARVYLPRAVSSSEPADIEMELLEDVVGLHRTLPSGTIFFTRHSVNPISQRLDMEVVFMVLPDGQEMQLSATIHSSGGGAGLAGAIITHSDTVAKSSAGKNILSGAQDAIGEAEISNPLAGIAGSVTTDVIESKKQLLPQPTGFSIQLAPQRALIRFRRSF